MFQNLEVIPFHSESGEVEHVCLCVFDVTIQASQNQQLQIFQKELEKEHQEQKQLIKKAIPWIATESSRSKNRNKIELTNWESQDICHS